MGLHIELLILTALETNANIIFQNKKTFIIFREKSRRSFVETRLQTITSAVRDTIVPRHNGGPIEDHIETLNYNNAVRGFRASGSPSIETPSCQKTPVSRTAIVFIVAGCFAVGVKKKFVSVRLS